MTKTDFAELKEKLVSFDENKFKEWSDDYRVAYSFWPSIKESVLWQHTKSAAIITELLEIISFQQEVFERIKTYVKPHRDGLDGRFEETKATIESCVAITETTTRLQKLREGK